MTEDDQNGQATDDGMPESYGCGQCIDGEPCMDKCIGIDRQSKLLCGLCGKPATGWAKVDGQRYCHGDDESSPTCYMRAQGII